MCVFLYSKEFKRANNWTYGSCQFCGLSLTTCKTELFGSFLPYSSPRFVSLFNPNLSDKFSFYFHEPFLL